MTVILLIYFSRQVGNALSVNIYSLDGVKLAYIQRSQVSRCPLV